MTAELNVEVLTEGEFDEVDPLWLGSKIAQACEHLGILRGDIVVNVVGDEAMSAAHEAHSGETGSTDVLTFDRTPEDGVSDCVEADVLVCVDVARREASQRNHPVNHELLLYVVHAILHCLGFDDHDDEGHHAMHAKEDAVLRAIGIGAIFDRSTGDDR